MKRLGSVVVAALALVSAGCFEASGQYARSASASTESAPAPEHGTLYTTRAHGSGVLGDGERFAAEVKQELAARGSEASSDGTLATAAARMARELIDGHEINQTTAEDTAQKPRTMA